MLQRTRKYFSLIGALPVLFSFSVFISPGVAQAQEVGGDLSGGAGIFRPKNPEAKRSSKPTRPATKPLATSVQTRVQTGGARSG